MLFAAVDVGSNTLRLLVAEARDGLLKPLRYERVITRLAAGVDDTGVLSEEAMRRSASVLRDFAGIIRGLGASRVRCVGTSALREARNATWFLGLARETSGLEVEVISGEEEAALTAQGVLASVERPESFVIVDIGGGSTEMIYSLKGGGLGHMTVPAGVVKMAEKHLKTDPPAESDLSGIKAEADEVARRLRKQAEGDIGRDAALIATAGTASTLAAMDLSLERFDAEKIHNRKIPRGRLKEMFSALKSMPLMERAGLKGLEAERADLIIPGIILTISLMETFGFSEMTVSGTGLLEGIVLELYRGGFLK